ncbi:chromate transporter [Bacillus sp. JJ634]
MIQKQLFISFFRSGLVGFGGGPATIPLIKKEVVEQYQMLTADEFYEIMAIGNTLPGPIATKLAGYIGYELAGIPGAFIAVFATVAPTTLLMIRLLSILAKYKKSLRVKRLTMFVVPIVGVLMLQLALKFLLESVNAMSWLPTILIAIASYIALQKFKFNPALVIVSALIIGALFSNAKPLFKDFPIALF